MSNTQHKLDILNRHPKRIAITKSHPAHRPRAEVQPCKNLGVALEKFSVSLLVSHWSKTQQPDTYTYI